MQLKLTLLYLLSLVTTVLTHGIVTSPRPRGIGPASLSACGQAITEIIKADNQTGIEALHAASSTSPDFDPKKCVLQLCKGLQLEDNLPDVQTWMPGQTVQMDVWTRIPHKGWMSVAVVDTKTLLLIGEELAAFETDSASGYGVHGLTKRHEKADMSFNVTIPKLYPRCAVPGDCVLQWTWFGRVVKQTYESCIDFQVLEDEMLVESDNLRTSGAIQKPLNF